LDRFDGRVAEAAGRATDLDRAGGDADALPEPEGFGEPQGGAPMDKEGFGEPQGGAPVGREGFGEPQGGAPINRGDDGLTGTG
jgi:hypothetical protein